MIKYIVKRLLLLIPVLFGVSLIVFFLMRVCAPDPAPIVLGQHATQESMDAWREANGLNDPVEMCIRDRRPVLQAAGQGPPGREAGGWNLRV